MSIIEIIFHKKGESNRTPSRMGQINGSASLKVVQKALLERCAS